jgi:hypothetical protein
MTNELNDLVPAQEKLEWVTPSITTWDIEETEKAGIVKPVEGTEGIGGPS